MQCLKPMRGAALGLALVLTALPAGAQPAAAQPAGAQAADQGAALFAAGRAAFEKGDFETACTKLGEALKISRRASTVCSLAQCEEKRGHLGAALKLWREGHTLLPADDERRPVAAERIVDLDRKVPRLSIEVAPDAPADAVVKVDGAEVARNALAAAMTLDPGAHVVTLTAAGRGTTTENVTLAEGESKTVKLKPAAVQAPVAPVAPPPVAPPPPPPPPPSGIGTVRAAGIAVGVVGVGLLAAGIGTGVVTMGKKSTADANCPPTVASGCNATGLAAESDGKTFSAVSTATFVVGLAAIGTGVALIVVGKPKAPATTGFTFAPLPSGGAMSLRGAF